MKWGGNSDQYFLLFGGNAFTGYLYVYVRHACLLLFVAMIVFSDGIHVFALAREIVSY